MYTVEEFDKLKTKVLKYIMYKKRTENEIKRKFSQEDSELLVNVIEHLKEIGYIDDKSYVERSVAEHINLNNLSLKKLVIFIIKYILALFLSQSYHHSLILPIYLLIY